MVYGLTNLAKMDDDSLDKMDPYQRGAHDISKWMTVFILIQTSYNESTPIWYPHGVSVNCYISGVPRIEGLSIHQRSKVKCFVMKKVKFKR